MGYNVRTEGKDWEQRNRSISLTAFCLNYHRDYKTTMSSDTVIHQNIKITH